MKRSILAMAMSMLLFTACNSGTKNHNAGMATDSAGTGTSERKKARATSTAGVVTAYLKLKNALTRDDGNSASQAGRSLAEALGAQDISLLTKKQSGVFTDIAEDAKEHAEHIGANAGNIRHQREHFETLSQEIYDLVKSGSPAGQKLYYDNCPMYNKGKGANWLSETKAIQNPYFGKEMQTCGSVKEELN